MRLCPLQMHPLHRDRCTHHALPSFSACACRLGAHATTVDGHPLDCSRDLLLMHVVIAAQAIIEPSPADGFLEETQSNTDIMAAEPETFAFQAGAPSAASLGSTSHKTPHLPHTSA